LFGLVLVAGLVGAAAARADEPDDLYLRALAIIRQADTLDSGGQAAPALAKYREALAVFQSIKRDNPGWNSQAVNYRFTYLAQKLDTLSKKLATPAKTAPAAGAPESPSDAASAAPAAGAAQVKLLAPGAEPRKALRLHPKPGDQQALELTLKIAMDIKAGAAPAQAMKMPALKMSLNATVKSVSAEGDITYDLAMGEAGVVEEPGAAPQMVEAMKTAVAGFKGISGSVTMSSRAVVKGTEMKAAGGANPLLGQTVDQLKEILSSMQTPLPEEAVGPGAKWEVKSPVKTGGVSADQTATIELVSLEDERFTIKSSIAARAAGQNIQNPAMQGMKINLTKFVGTSTGTATHDLGQLMPQEGASDAHTEVSATMDMGGQKQPMTTKTDVKVKLQAK
jgi:hypothetical protein